MAFLRALAEVDERKLYADLAYSSLFAYCCEELHLSEDAAFRRIATARAGRRFPRVFSMIASGELHMSGAAKLKKYLTPENHEELLGAAVPPAKRYIPDAVKRAVAERDGGCCTFVSNDGRRCAATANLEFDHQTPVARGGSSTVSNVRLRCRTHNQHAAEQIFGRSFMERKRAITLPWRRLPRHGSTRPRLEPGASDGLSEGESRLRCSARPRLVGAQVGCGRDSQRGCQDRR